MIKIAICEDDREDCLTLEKYVREYALEKKVEFILRIFESAEKYMESKFTPDILLLDILMNEKDGLQLGREIRNGDNNIIIIYTTSLEEKMVQAFNQIHSFGFLVKPIGKSQLFKMLDDAIGDISKSVHVQCVTFESENNTLISLPVMDIYYFEYYNRKIKIVAKEKDYICINEKIRGIADKMEGYGFIMSHQSFVVNLYHVDKIMAQELIMKNGASVFLAQKRASAVRKKMMQVVKETIANGGSKS